ncbi:hypothetical protein ACUA1E_004452 [Citrobacter koseri]
MQFTKEQLIAKAREQIAFCRHTNITGEGRTHVNQCSALFEIALASLEAEPVAEVCEGFTLRYIGHGPAPKSGVRIGDRLYGAPPALVANAYPLLEFVKEYIESWDLGMAGDSGLLASAKQAIVDSAIQQPAPVVPPEQNWEELCRQHPDMSIGDAIIRAAWWNLCRAAMLNGGKS